MNVAILVIFAIVFLAILSPIIGINTIFLGLGIFLAIILFERNQDLKKNIYKMPKDTLHITNVDKGGVFKLTGIGENSEEMTLTVLSKHLYQEGDFYWYELECDKGEGDKVWIEVEDDDDVKVSIVLKKMTLSDISISKFQLDKFDDEESGNIEYLSKKFKYIESDEAIFYRFCDDKNPEKLYYWDFKNDNYTVSVEKWNDKEYEVFYSQNLKPGQITVYANTSEGSI